MYDKNNHCGKSLVHNEQHKSAHPAPAKLRRLILNGHAPYQQKAQHGKQGIISSQRDKPGGTVVNARNQFHDNVQKIDEKPAAQRNSGAEMDVPHKPFPDGGGTEFFHQRMIQNIRFDFLRRHLQIRQPCDGDDQRIGGGNVRGIFQKKVLNVKHSDSKDKSITEQRQKRRGKRRQKEVFLRIVFHFSIRRPPDFHGKGAIPPHFALHGNIPSHNVRHSFYKRKPQTVALGGVGGVALIECFKNMCAHLRRDAAAGIGYLDSGVIPRAFQRNRNRAAVLRKFQRIGEQVVPDQGQQFIVRFYKDFLRDVGLNLDALRFPCALKAQKALGKLLAEIVPLHCGINLLVFQPVQL